jgi:hypothetical protein
MHISALVVCGLLPLLIAAAPAAKKEPPTSPMHHMVNFKFMKDAAAIEEIGLDKDQKKEMADRIAKGRKECEDYLATKPAKPAEQVHKLMFEANNDYMKILGHEDLTNFNDRVWGINNEVLALTAPTKYKYAEELKGLGLTAEQQKKMDGVFADHDKAIKALGRKYPIGRDGGQALNYHTVEASFGARKKMWDVMSEEQRSKWWEIQRPKRNQ